jgi:SpoVK/Ycf46/Vps4 family AAA+-type ATPase
MNFNDELTLLLKARYPIIFIDTIEEDRAEYVIRKAIKSSFNRSIYSWDFVDGYTNNPNNEGFAKRNPALFLLKDFNRFLNDISISRKLRNLSRILKLQPKTIIIIGSELNLPKELRDLITIIKFQLPTENEINQELNRLIDSLSLSIDSKLIENLTRACQGLSLERIRRVLSKIIASYKTIDESSISVLLSEKKQIIGQTGILDYWSTNEKIQNIGGVDNLKNWLNKRKTSFSLQALNYGLPTPRGLLLIGIQGTGKSLTAKAIATEWQLPLLKLDVGKLFGGIIGESESRLRQMIEVAEAISPCILWIDEIDKAFSINDNKGDSGTSNRILATFISWLSEKTKPVFVVATANNIDLLPLELIRKGRFDEIFFLDLPKKREREQIFKIHIQEFRPKTWNMFDYSKLALLSECFSGAEIRQSIIEGMYHAFYEKREFTTEDICFALRELIPLAQLENNQTLKLQSWASSGRIRSASSKNIYKN